MDRELANLVDKEVVVVTEIAGKLVEFAGFLRKLFHTNCFFVGQQNHVHKSPHVNVWKDDSIYFDRESVLSIYGKQITVK